MRKGNLINLMVGAAMLLTMSFGLSSCEDILGEWDKPAPFHVNVDGTNEVTITKTETGATVTVNTPSDITNFLSQVKDDITAKGTEEYVFDIACSGVKSSSGDNTITVPKVDGSNINLVFEKGINTESPLIIKASETASATPTTAVNKLTITMPAGTTSLNLVIDMPETSVTVKTSAGSVIYEGIVANTATNTLIIESGVTVKSLQVKGGIVVVKDGGKVETNVYAPESNDYVMYQYGDQEGVEPVWVDLKGDGNYVPNVQNEDGSAYLFKNLKVIKGTADYAKIALYNSQTPLEKLTIADGAVVLVNYQPSVKTIEGEGSATLLFDDWWENDSKYYNDGNLYSVDEISNVTIGEYLPSDVQGTIDQSYLYNVPTNIENVIFKMGSVGFKDPKSANATVKNCKFVGAGNYRGVTISVPYQTEEISNFKFIFDGCEFIDNCRFSCRINSWKPKLDDEGNEIYKTYYCWWEDPTDNNNWNQGRSEDEKDIPAERKSVGETYNYGWGDDGSRSTGYWIVNERQEEIVTYNDYYAYVVFNSCKYAGVTLTSETLLLDSAGAPEGAYLRFEIDGTLYKAEWDSESGKYILIPA